MDYLTVYDVILKEIRNQAQHGTLTIVDNNEIILTKGIIHELKAAGLKLND